MSNKQQPTIYLASGSPRRHELLTQLGVDFVKINNDFDETWQDGESPKAYVERVALGKATSALNGEHYQSRYPVLGADTTVVHNNEPLGKPKDLDYAAELLMRLSGQQHTVMSSVALLTADETTPDEILQVTVVTEVWFAQLSDEVIANYCRSQEPLGKAGGYAIQGLGGCLIEKINGSYTNVVGLPLYETRQLLEKANIHFALS